MATVVDPDPTLILSEPSPRRVSGLVLLREAGGCIYLLDPTYRDGMILPGGSALPDESPNEAAARHLAAKTGLVLDVYRLITFDHVPANRWPEGFNFIFDGGVLTPGQMARMHVPPPEESRLRGGHWVRPTDMHRFTAPKQRARITAALELLHEGSVTHPLADGQRVG
ncbi:NUDIX domain-containing protein [Kitasatospora sp. P5_F3]